MKMIKTSTIRAGLLSGILMASAFTAHAGEDYSQWFEEFQEDVQEYKKAQNPRWAAREGDESAKGKLRDVSAEAYQQRKQKLTDLINELNSIQRSGLSADEQISYDMMMTQLKQDVSDIEFKTYQMPLTSEYGFHAQTTNLANSFRFSCGTDVF